MSIRINKVIKEFNVGLQTVVDALASKGIEVKPSPSEKISEEHYEMLKSMFGADKNLRSAAEQLLQSRQKEKKVEKPAPQVEEIATEVPEEKKPQLKIMGQIDLDAKKAKKEEPAKEPETKPVVEEQEEPVVAKEEVVVEEKQAEQPADQEPPVEEKPVKEEKPIVEEKPAEEEAPAEEEKPVEKAEEPASEPVADNKEEQQTDDKAGEKEVFRPTKTPELQGPKVLGTIDLSSINEQMRPKKKSKEELRKEREKKRQGNGEKKKRNRINGAKVDVNAAAKQAEANERNRKQMQQQSQNESKRSKKKNRNQQPLKQEVSDEDVAKQVRETLARLTNKNKTAKGAKYRREKREMVRQQQEEQLRDEMAESKIIKLTEFVTANELATMMNVPVIQVISTCMSIGIMVSINQRLDAETIDLVAEEFGFKTEYTSAEVSEAVAEEEDSEEDLVERAPIVTVMGHVDHGKTSLLDHIRNANVIAGEAGGITQHIGAYNVKLKNGRHITFLDTPGHEAFTAMRARGAQVTDIAIIIIAADDDIMPQTKEAISHAVAANVPIVFAINKIDKPGANPDKIKEGLAQMNFLVEEWGGKYQSQDISAKKGDGVYELLEKVLLEADMLELKANPNRNASGTVIESSLDKGRGYVATVLISNGTLRQGDIILAGTNYGRVKALFNERGQRIKEVGPSQAATVLGLNGASQAGDQLHSMNTEQEAREIATKREQLAREQGLRTTRRRGLDDIAHEIAVGGVQELNLLVKGDVDGSVEALSDSFIKLSTEKIVVNVIHKGVGQISENDVTLAAASKAVIIGFQVRPSANARKLADQEGVEIRQYSIIYDAIEEIKGTMEGMLKPIIKEEVTAMVEVRQVYRISKVGLVAGSYVVDGKVSRTDKARLIRDGIVVFTGNIMALKRFKDDVKEVNTNFECGISLQNCNDIKEGDTIETFKEIEVKQKL